MCAYVATPVCEGTATPPVTLRTGGYAALATAGGVTPACPVAVREGGLFPYKDVTGLVGDAGIAVDAGTDALDPVALRDGGVAADAAAAVGLTTPVDAGDGLFPATDGTDNAMFNS